MKLPVFLLSQFCRHGDNCTAPSHTLFVSVLKHMFKKAYFTSVFNVYCPFDAIIFNHFVTF